MRKQSINKRKWILTGAVTGVILATTLVALGNAGKWFAPPDEAPLPSSRSELEKIIARYADSRLQMQGSIHLFDGPERKTAVEQSTFRIIRHGTDYWSELGFLVTGYADGWSFYMDTASKMISVARAEPLPGTSAAQIPIEQLLSDTAAFRIKAEVGRAGRERSLWLVSDLNPEMKEAVLYYDTATYLIQRAEMTWRKNPATGESTDSPGETWVTVVEYQYPVGGILPKDELNKVVNMRDNRPVLQQTYKNYRLIENINE